MLTTSLLVLALTGCPAAPPAPLDVEFDTGFDDEYEQLTEAYSKAALDWRRAQRKARKAKTDFTDPHPVHEYFPRFEAFAARGESAAQLWIGVNAEDLGLSKDETAARKRAAFGSLVEAAADDPELMKTFLLKVDRQGKWLSDDELIAFLVPVFEKNGETELRENAAFKVAQRYERIGTDVSLDQAQSWYENIISSFPDSSSADRARDALIGMNVAVGRIAPDFETFDTDGTAFKLSDYRGKVVVIDFWGFW